MCWYMFVYGCICLSWDQTQNCSRRTSCVARASSLD